MNAKFIAIVLIIITGLVFLFNLQRYFDYTMDDAFIILRYAENLAEHGKLVFNLNEYPPSEGITSPIWAIILSIFIILKTDPIIIGKILGLLFTLVSCFVMFLLTSKIIDTHSNIENNIFIKKLMPFFVVSIFLIDPNTAINSVSGMETPLGTFLFLAFIYLILFSKSNNSKIISSLFGLAAILARPEVSILIIIIYILALFFYKENRKSYSIALILFLIIGFIYFIFRYTYYQMLFPLPFYIKQSRMAGINEVVNFFRYNFIYFFFLAYLILEIYKKNVLDKRIHILLTILIINLIYLSTIKHIMGFGFRYFQLIYPILIIIASYGLYLFVHNFYKKNRNYYIVFLTLILSSIFILFINIKKENLASKTFIAWYIPAENNVISIAKKLANLKSERQITIGINDCGAIPYFSKANTIDFAGLNNRFIATNFNSSTLINEIQKQKADIVIIGSKSLNEYRPLWNVLEIGFYKIAEKMGYQCIIKNKFYPDHYYWIYTNNTALSNQLITMF